MCDRIALRGGILIIGSLLWDTRRQPWREARLQLEGLQAVSAPIRYGRLSEGRGNTYTMVFSRLCEPGQAIVVPFKGVVTSANDLVAEAEHLWAAERNGDLERRISAGWGCVALLPNPDRDIPRPILTAWANRVSQERCYGNVPQTQAEGSLVGSDGLLQISWPRLVSDNAAVPLDFLLATATHPTLEGTPPSYPSADTIAHAWNADRHNQVEYFWRNVDSGIRTFQDDAIREQLRPRE